ncbi:MAG: ACT domain-containing protein [Candidatus Moduliflexus flocculans]|nr:ACT domain-containing protein [Candidatus Moduliflexus flocculans]
MTSVSEDTELTVTTPDEPGIFGRVLGTLANAGVNVRGLLCLFRDRSRGTSTSSRQTPRRRKRP